MAAARDPLGDRGGARRALLEQRRGETARDRALARTRGAVEEIGVRGLPAGGERGLQDRGGVRMARGIGQARRG